MLVNGRVFFNEQIALRHVGFGLVIVVVAHEVFHRIFREKLAKLAVQLRRQRFVRCKNNSRPTKPGDDIGHGVGLTGARHAQQSLENLAIVHAFNQLFNRLRLVASRQVGLKQLKG